MSVLNRLHPLYLAGFLLALLFVAINLTRPLLPIDETRYLTVAWEYFNRGEWILPTLNYDPYHHKPPMLFWLINIMWQITGTTSIWAARLVPLAACLASITLTYKIARTLWPQSPETARLIPYLVLATPFMMIYGSLIMFDTLLAVAVLAAIYALLKFYLTERRIYWIYIGIAIGMGVLIKGPVILLHLLPVILLFPLWQKELKADRSVWLEGLVFAIMTGAVIALSWAIPAGKIGGPEYENMIFWGQSAGRMVKSFDHARPFWFYLLLLPAIFLPWAFLRPLWRGAHKPVRADLWRNRSWQTRFIICWIAPVFLSFMMISGKQVHYILPLVPGAFLLLAHVITSRNLLSNLRPDRLYLYAVAPITIIAALMMLVELFGFTFAHEKISNATTQLADTNFLYLLLVIAACAGTYFAMRGIHHRLTLTNTLQAIATTNIIFLMALHASLAPMLSKYYDLAPAGRAVLEASALGAPVATPRIWQGELGYLAHMASPVVVLPDETDIKPWLQKNPNGIVIVRHRADEPPYGFRVIYTQPYRSPTKALTVITTNKP